MSGRDRVNSDSTSRSIHERNSPTQPDNDKHHHWERLCVWCMRAILLGVTIIFCGLCFIYGFAQQTETRLFSFICDPNKEPSLQEFRDNPQFTNVSSSCLSTVPGAINHTQIFDANPSEPVLGNINFRACLFYSACILFLAMAIWQIHGIITSRRRELRKRNKRRSLNVTELTEVGNCTICCWAFLDEGWHVQTKVTNDIYDGCLNYLKMDISKLWVYDEPAWIVKHLLSEIAEIVTQSISLFVYGGYNVFTPNAIVPTESTANVMRLAVIVGCNAIFSGGVWMIYGAFPLHCHGSFFASIIFSCDALFEVLYVIYPLTIQRIYSDSSLARLNFRQNTIPFLTTLLPITLLALKVYCLVSQLTIDAEDLFHQLFKSPHRTKPPRIPDINPEQTKPLSPRVEPDIKSSSHLQAVNENFSQYSKASSDSTITSSSSLELTTAEQKEDQQNESIPSYLVHVPKKSHLMQALEEANELSAQRNRREDLPDMISCLVSTAGAIFITFGIAVIGLCASHFERSTQFCAKPNANVLEAHPELGLWPGCVERVYPFFSSFPCNCRYWSYLRYEYVRCTKYTNASVVKAMLDNWDRLEKFHLQWGLIEKFLGKGNLPCEIRSNDTFIKLDEHSFRAKHMRLFELEGVPNIIIQSNLLNKWEKLEYFRTNKVPAWTDEFWNNTAAWKEIQVIALSKTKIKTLPKQACNNFKKLQLFDAPGTPFESIDPCWADMKKLVRLDISGSFIRKFPWELIRAGRNTKLKTLKLFFSTLLDVSELINNTNFVVSSEINFLYAQYSPLCDANVFPYLSRSLRNLLETNETKNTGCTKTCSTINSQCAPWMLGNGICNSQCNHKECGFDNGDCRLGCPLSECPKLNFGNKTLSGSCLNTSQAMCVQESCGQKGTCRCAKEITQCRLKCKNEWRRNVCGDSWCDEECNDAACGYDDGDCKIGTCPGSCRNALNVFSQIAGKDEMIDVREWCHFFNTSNSRDVGFRLMNGNVSRNCYDSFESVDGMMVRNDSVKGKVGFHAIIGVFESLQVPRLEWTRWVQVNCSRCLSNPRVYYA